MRLGSIDVTSLQKRDQTNEEKSGSKGDMIKQNEKWF
jgi:hypothetical protein